jgi:CRISPR-associated endonuclease Csn1
MPNLLGLSIDINVIGWTLVDSDTGKIQAMGNLVFQQGSENFGSGKREISKKASRRLKRVSRVRVARQRTRKIKVLELLVDHGMCPLDRNALRNWQTQKKYPEQKQLADWMAMDPYNLRSRGVEEALSLHEIGRVLYHYTQRRGFPMGDRGLEAQNNKLFKGNLSFDRYGISHSEEEIGEGLLIHYLETLKPQENQSYQYQNQRVRNRFLTRTMYQQEAHALWDSQCHFHSSLTPELKTLLIGASSVEKQNIGAVFYQRPLKSQKHRVGNCVYESSKTKCCISSLVYQELLAYRWANTIMKDGQPLSEKERHKVVRYFMSHKKFQFLEIKRILNPSTALYNKKSDEIIIGSFINAELSKSYYFGHQWFETENKTKEDIWHALYFFKDKKKLAELAELKWGFATPQAQKIARISIDKRYAPISRKAASNILYFLKKGVTYELAVVLAGVKNSLGASWANIALSDIDFIIRRVLQLYRENPVSGFIVKLQTFLIEDMQLKDFQIKKLYGQSASLENFPVTTTFPLTKEVDKEIYNFKNPLLITPIFQLRKLINDLVARFGAMDRINLELSTNLKVNKYQRYLSKLDHKRLDSRRDHAIKELRALVENITYTNVLKYQLWEECKRTCPYTGEDISLDVLFTDEVRVVYILPWERSINDNMTNKTLCMRGMADLVEGYTPYDFFTEHRPYDWEGVKRRAARLFSNTAEYPTGYKKFKSFIKKYQRRHFLNHQLSDPSFLAKEIQCFMTKVCPDVRVAQGYAVPHLVDEWLLKNVLPFPDAHEHCEDFRYYALRSYVIAQLCIEYLESLAKRNKYINRQNTHVEKMRIPYDGFRDEVEYHLNAIIVSHQKHQKLVVRRPLKHVYKGMVRSNFGVAIRGPLHKETVYGKRTTPDGQTGFHIRKPLELINTKHQVEKIVDPYIRQLVEAHIENNGGYSDNKVPRNIFFDTDDAGLRSPKLFLPNHQGGDPVPIRKIRLRETLSRTVELKKDLNQHVNLRNNHHVVIYQDQQGDYQEDLVSFWEMVQRKCNDQPLYQIPDSKGQIITTLHINDLFIMGVKDLDEDLSKESKSFLMRHVYRVQKLSTKFYEFRLAYNNQLGNNDFPNYIRINNFGKRKTGWFSYHPQKIEVSLSGQIRRAAIPTLSTQKPQTSMS